MAIFNNEEDSRKFAKWGFVAVLLLCAFLVVATLGAFKDLWQPSSAPNTITVTGEGESISIPNLATFSFTVSADAKTASEAQSMVTEKMNDILDALKDMGIEDKDIKTSGYNLYPQYSYRPSVCTPTSCPPSTQTLDGYTASHNIEVNLRETEKSGEALVLVGDKGATNISGITFTEEDPDAVIAEAREEAIRDAREKAKILARQLGVRIVRVVSYSDDSAGYPRPIPYYGGVALEAKSEDAVAPNIPQGENKLTVHVNVVYEIR